MTRTVAQHWKGTKAAAAIAGLELVGASPFVGQSMAEQRATICKGCDHNDKSEVGAIADAEDNLIALRLQGRSTQADSKLGHCDVCSCKISTIVHMKPIVLKIGVTDDEVKQYPEHCWKHNFL